MQSLKNAKHRARDWWVSLSSSERSNLIKGVATTGVVVTLVGFYYMGQSDNKKKAVAAPLSEEVVPKDFLDRDIDQRIEDAVKKVLEEQLGKITKPVVNEPLEPSLEDLNLLEDGQIEPNSYQGLDDLDFGGVSGYPEYTPSPQEAPQVEVNTAPVYVGGISTQTVYTPPPPAQKVKPSDKIPVPPGFMPAMMIVGVHAQVSQSGSGNPKPIHLRVQAPATLPNKIKMNLSGCIVIANTWGNLSSERIEGETVSLSCMTADKKTLIEGKLKGYLADKDGQRDIAGRVVTKAGSLISRQIAADTFAGIGNSISANSGETAVSPLGTVSNIDGKEAFSKGAASGVAGGFNGAADFISDLIEQSGPVIESGAAREVMIMVQETSWLSITDLEKGQPITESNANTEGEA